MKNYKYFSFVDTTSRFENHNLDIYIVKDMRLKKRKKNHERH